MPYVTRGADRRIQTLHREPTAEAREFVSAEDAEVRSFLGLAPTPADDFGRLDADFVRVIEDVIDTLIVRNVINITDLPEQAQAKLFARKSFRERATRNSLRLFSESTFGDVVDDTHLGDLR